ncbi:MAG TPA: DUF1080 domain-containing protein [Gemmatimonadaceae bacterium]|nr:DUF1080 domain-containing protein [Gemmatimonadaceae bacterium]
MALSRAASAVVLLLAAGCASRPRTPPTPPAPVLLPSRIVTAYAVHSMVRPQPPVVTPAPAGEPVPPPSDAIVLFDGKDLSNWRSADSAGAPAQWKVENGYMEVAGKQSIETTRAFGDVQLHVEWATPTPATGEGQERGNSGVYLMGKYELQILDSYHNTTYADGQAAAIFGQYPPMVNASRAPGEWQTYDIIFRRPRFSPKGELLRRARMTVVHNGVLVQDDAVLTGPTAFGERPPYVAHPDSLPLMLQNHGYPVRFRDIWVRPLPETDH